MQRAVFDLFVPDLERAPHYIMVGAGKDTSKEAGRSCLRQEKLVIEFG